MKHIAYYSIILVIGGTAFSKDSSSLSSTWLDKLTWQQLNSNQFATGIDSSIKWKYEPVLSINSKTIDENAVGGVEWELPLHNLLGKTLSASVPLRTKDVRSQSVLTLRIDGPDGVIFYNNMLGMGASGTMDWTQFYQKAIVPKNARRIVLQVIQTGTGKTWVGPLKLQGDNKIVDFSPLTLNEQEKTEFRKNVVPLKIKSQMRDNSLDSVGKLIGDSKIVALGESVHGASEFFKIKLEIMRYLIEQKGFRLFALEVNMPEAERLNKFLLSGNGDIKRLLKDLGFWTWNTTEMLNVFNYIKKYNTNHSDKIIFYGFDMQIADLSIKSLEKFFDSPKYKRQTELLSNLEKYIDNIKKDNKEIIRNGGVSYDSALELEDFIVNKMPHDTKNWTLASSSIRLIRQRVALDLEDIASRDRSMAENVISILESHPGQKMLLWAHNRHIQKDGNTMGSELFYKLSNNYYALGFAFMSGNYLAKSNNIISDKNKAPPAPKGSLEACLSSINIPLYFFDVRKLSESKHGDWINFPIPFRNIGASPSNSFDPHVISKEFDSMIFVRNITPSHLIK